MLSAGLSLGRLGSFRRRRDPACRHISGTSGHNPAGLGAFALGSIGFVSYGAGLRESGWFLVGAKLVFAIRPIARRAKTRQASPLHASRTHRVRFWSRSPARWVRFAKPPRKVNPRQLTSTEVNTGHRGARRNERQARGIRDADPRHRRSWKPPRRTPAGGGPFDPHFSTRLNACRPEMHASARRAAFALIAAAGKSQRRGR